AGGDDAGRLVLETTLAVRGLSLPTTVYADLTLTGAQLSVRPAEVELSAVGLRIPASRLPAAAAQARTVDLPALPAGLAYRSVSATPDGLRIVAGGSGLTFGPSTTTTINPQTCGGTAQ
ncbi:hypothetical protein, partial [Escherichia coli]|uniref:hypothetical protein n=1 Tax=Escherichia coli TaxID=562 RepID=UPI003C2EC4C4